MAKDKAGTCCTPAVQPGTYKVEALVSIDARGQMVLPKDLRDRAGIKEGDKLAISTLEQAGKVCCLLMIKADDLTGLVKEMLGPDMQEITKK
jgi:AbrB family looped-hinge helix DNA binding protein